MQCTLKYCTFTVKPTCQPECENNGTCIADDTCKCAPGFYGNRCEIGWFICI
jgi:hypothetical protein